MCRSMVQAANVPRASVPAEAALARIEPPVGVADGTAWQARAGKSAAILKRSTVRHEFDRNAPPSEHPGKRLGRKQVPARTACGEQDRPVSPVQTRCHHQDSLPSGSISSTAARGRLRVTATRNPIARASEIIDDPP